MEIRIGIQHSPREIVIESSLDTQELQTRLREGIDQGSTISLEDTKKGRLVLVPGAKVAYAEISSDEPRRVGFLG